TSSCAYSRPRANNWLKPRVGTGNARVPPCAAALALLAAPHLNNHLPAPILGIPGVAPVPRLVEHEQCHPDGSQSARPAGPAPARPAHLGHGPVQLSLILLLAAGALPRALRVHDDGRESVLRSGAAPCS